MLQFKMKTDKATMISNYPVMVLRNRVIYPKNNKKHHKP